MDAFWNKYDYPLTDKHAIKLIKQKAKEAYEAEKSGADPYECLKLVHAMIEDFCKEHGCQIEGTISMLPATVK